jgi:uncharacterized repeat protein (TIGR02543 family)
MLSTACNISDPSEIPPSIEDGYGKISINFTIGETAARTVMPSKDFGKYEYTFTKDGAAAGEVRIPADGSFLLEVGNYTVSVKAYAGNAEPYTLAASGVSSTFSVTAGTNPPVQVNLNPVDDDEMGIFTYTITYTAGATAVITLHKWPDLTNNIPLSPTDIANGKTETLELEAGSYLLTVRISLADLIMGISEAVHIYPLLSTEYINDFSIFVVTFDANGGTGTPPAAITTGSGFEITLPDDNGLEMSGYTFGGWNTNSSGTGTNYNAGASYTVSGDTTLYARWVYTITFDANDGSGTAPAVITANAGSSITLPDQGSLTRTGYTFGGWNTNSSGTGTNYNAGASYTVNNNTTLYARWLPPDGSEVDPFPLTAGTWANDSIASSGSVVWYSFNVTSGTTYYVWWNDNYQGNSTKTLDVKVSANYSSSGTSIFSGVDSGWTTPRSFTANSNGTVKIKVEPYSSGTGTFAVVYSTGSTRP